MKERFLKDVTRKTGIFPVDGTFKRKVRRGKEEEG